MTHDKFSNCRSDGQSPIEETQAAQKGGGRPGLREVLVTERNLRHLLRGVPCALFKEIESADAKEFPEYPGSQRYIWQRDLHYRSIYGGGIRKREETINLLCRVGWAGENFRLYAAGRDVVMYTFEPCFQIDDEQQAEIAWIARTWGLTADIDFEGRRVKLSKSKARPRLMSRRSPCAQVAFTVRKLVSAEAPPLDDAASARLLASILRDDRPEIPESPIGLDAEWAKLLDLICEVGGGWDEYWYPLSDEELSFYAKLPEMGLTADDFWARLTNRRAVIQYAIRIAGSAIEAAQAEQSPPADDAQEWAEEEAKPATATVEATGPSVETPHDLARYMIAKNYKHTDSITLRYWRSEFHTWRNNRWTPVLAKEFAALVARSAREAFDEDFIYKLGAYTRAKKVGEAEKKQPPKKRPVTKTVVGDVTQALADCTLLQSDDVPAQPAWIGKPGPWPAEEILPMADGLIHLPSLLEGRLAILPPTPLFFGRYALSYAYDPDAPEPAEWLKFLASAWGDDRESIELLQDWMGYLLTPDTSLEKILMMIGPPRSGKGTIAKVITALVGPENVVNPTLSGLEKQFGLAPLIGKLVAIIGDARISGRTDTATVVERLLSISGTDSQTIDRKHKDEVTLRLPTRFTIISNELPHMKDASTAFQNRMVILRTVHSNLGKEDRTLIDRLQAELPGILNWSVAGLRRLRERGRLIEPASSRDLKDTWVESSSPVAAFIKERCVVSLGPPKSAGEPMILCSELFMAYKNWSLAKGREHPGDEIRFGRDLRAAVPTVGKKNPRMGNARPWHYTGIRLKTEGEMMADDDDE